MKKWVALVVLLAAALGAVVLTRPDSATQALPKYPARFVVRGLTLGAVK